MAESKKPKKRVAISAKAISDLLSAPNYRPLDRDGLADALNVAPRQRGRFDSLIHKMLQDGTIVCLRHKGLALARSADLVTGTITIVRSGAGFVNTDDTHHDIYIPPRETGTALPGDRVLVRLQSKHSRRDTRSRDGRAREGTVIRVLERNTLTLVGTLQRKRKIFYVEPLRASITHDVIVSSAGGANIGDRVLVELDEWDDPRLPPEGEITDVIGPADNPALDTQAVIRSYDLPQTFPPSVIRAAEAARITDDDIDSRLDLRQKFIFTIDPDTARDFDDALSLEAGRNGTWKLGIHIADVSHFVTANSALDKEARKRGTSVYLPDTVIPMLPEQLSNGLCSLVPKRDRLAFSVIITLDRDATPMKATFAPSVIHSQLRLTYEQAMAVLQLPDNGALPDAGVTRRTATTIKQIHNIAQRLRTRRMENGALNMHVPEAKFVIGKDGRIDDIVPQKNDISHQLIEECMLLANEMVCRELGQRDLPQLYRIHEEPDPEKLAQLETVLLAGGVRAQVANRDDLARLLAEIENAPQAHAWNTAVLRAMKRARYSVEALGHYGLAKQYYCHFTSPIRRYPDLVQHRILRAAVANKTTRYNRRVVEELANHCSRREDIAIEAERDVMELKRLRFFAEQLASGNLSQYKAVVVEVRNYGMMLDLPDVAAFGMIHVSQLEDDFYDFDADQYELRGRQSGTIYSFGMTLDVVIARVDTQRHFLDFVPVRQNQTVRKSVRQKPGKEKQKHARRERRHRNEKRRR